MITKGTTITFDRCSRTTVVSFRNYRRFRDIEGIYSSSPGRRSNFCSNGTPRPCPKTVSVVAGGSVCVTNDSDSWTIYKLRKLREWHSSSSSFWSATSSQPGRASRVITPIDPRTSSNASDRTVFHSNGNTEKLRATRPIPFLRLRVRVRATALHRLATLTSFGIDSFGARRVKK